MCGNGGRCITHFAKYLGIIETMATFDAVDGLHEATIGAETVSLKMHDVTSVKVHNEYIFLNTGSPHHVQLVSGLDTFDVFSEGRSIRNTRYGKEGANVNFVEACGNDIFSVRTYERGVEDETLSCGTGVTAVAIALFETGNTLKNDVALKTPGGMLQVTFDKTTSGYENIRLIGPATLVFKGVWSYE
jgi:diaminopimelate epimerase